MAPPSLPPSAYVRPVPPESDSQPDESKSTAGNNLLSRSLNPPPSPNPVIHRVSFNQDFGCFAVGLDTGFRTYLCDPFVPRYRQDFDSGRGSGGGSGLGLVAMLFRTNLYCLVGGGPNPLFPLNKVLIWDEQARQCRGELSFRSEVKSVKLRRDRIVVITLQKVFVYNFMDFRLLHQIETAVNAKGLCEVSQAATPMLLVCPGAVKGQIRVEDFGSKRTRFVTAHDSSIACLAMTLDGRFFATASSKGTLIRVFNTLDGSLLQELRRGADRADIFSLAFSSNAQWLAVSSDKGTVHVFNLKVDSGSLANDRSHGSSESNHSTSLRSLSIFKGVLPKYFKSEWSVAQFRLPEGLQYFVGFQQKNIIVIVGMDGSFYRCEFDPLNGGEMTQLERHNFMNASNFLKP